MPNPSSTHAEHAIGFGRFRLIPARQLLLDGDRPIRVGSRALEILTLLLEHPGEVVDKDAIVARVWPRTFVDEANLRVHIAALRKALGGGEATARYIVTVPGRGYRFAVPVQRFDEIPPAAPAPEGHRPASNLPAPPTRMIGRAEIVAALAGQMSEARFVTVVGPGGIGKTTLALAVAHRLQGSYPDGAWFIDLSPLVDEQLVASAVAYSLNLAVHAQDPTPVLASFLRDKQALLVLDSCEHVIEAAATLAENLLRSAPGTHILATSREPLRAQGEHVQRLAPLPVPPVAAKLGAADALTFPAVRLFVERANASTGDFELSDAEAPLVAEICRRLDGIALAIEIVAGQVDVFGVAGVAAALDTRFQLLMQGRRTSLPRHRTLSATFDWSYAQLSELERLVLRRLGVFAGTFTLAAASAVVAGGDIPVPESVSAISNLVTKSLVSADIHGTVAFYRLLDATRAYALEKLEESGERERLARRHADHYRTQLEQAQDGWQTQPASEWLEQNRHLVDNARAALDWSFSPSGDPAIGVALTLATVPLWFELSLTGECVQRVAAALAAPAESRTAEQEMHLCAAQAWSLMQARGSVPETQAAWTRTLELAEQQEDIDHQLRAIWGLWAGLLNRCELRPALMRAQQFCELAARQTDPSDSFVGHRMVGYILHLMGRQSEARDHMERMLDGYESPSAGAAIIRFVFDQRATAECFLARILWLQGYPDRSMTVIDAVLRRAAASDDVLSLCQVLVQGACPVAFFVSDLAAAERYVTMLLGHAERHAFLFWQAFGRCFQSGLAIKRGQVDAGLKLLATALDELRDIQFGVYYTVFLSDYAEALARVGRSADALATIGEALARSERNEERWYRPELLRIKGALTLLAAEADAPAAAEGLFREALRCAGDQGALSWELRAATALAKLLQTQDRNAEAHDCLAPIYARFTEGFATTDLREASGLLADPDRPRGPRRKAAIRS